MGLRRQLLLFGSLSLALPWAGVQYVREMESTLRHGQAMALGATAHAVAARVASDESLLQLIARQNVDAGIMSTQPVIYAHPTLAPLPLDGYDDDWRNLAHDWQAPTPLGEFKTTPRMWIARRGDNLHIFIKVVDASRQFYNPAQNGVSADRVEFHVKPQRTDAIRHLRLYSAAPGPVLAESSVQPGVWQRDHRIQAVWDEQEDGYAVEIKMPYALAQNGMAAAVIDGESWGDSSWPVPATLSPVITRDDSLDALLKIFSPPGVRLYMINGDGWIIASAGALDPPDEHSGFTQLQRQWVRKILGQSEFAILDNVNSGGAFTDETALSVVNGSGGGDNRSLPIAWYRHGDGVVGRVLQPVEMGQSQRVAAIVAEQTTDSVDQLTSGAAGRLLLYSMMAALMAAVGLLGFASVLSYRVRRLSLQAQAAVDRDGRIGSPFRGSRRNDELGELSRQYAALLARLRNYTHYLETLASKLSHELRTPLAVVRSSLDNLSQVELSSEAQMYCARANSGSERLSAILNAMSAAARLEQCINSTEVELVNLREMLPHVVAAYGDLFQSTPVVLTITGEYRADVMIAPELFVQMLDKLVENAADFSEAGSAITVRLLCQSQQLTLSVSNIGPPIPEAMLATIFDPLVSARASVDDVHHLGLGLYVVRLVAQFHGATLRAVNDEARGMVRFEVVLTPASVRLS